MIRFRKAGAPSASIAQAAASPAASPAANAAGQKANPWKPVSAAPLEWWQTPEKYKKRPIDDLECDIINVKSN